MNHSFASSLWLTCVLLWTSALLFAEPAPAVKAVDGKGKSAAELKSQVMDLAARGKLTDTLIARYKDYAWRRAVEKTGSVVPEAFWTWASANPTLRDGLILALHPDDNPHIVKRLWELRQEFGDRVDEYAHLALAFAVVFGRAGEGDPWSDRPRVTEYLRHDRKPPGMTESFAYYLEHHKRMRFPLQTTPWPLLVFVADNEIPIEERRWVLRNYAKVPDERLAEIDRDLLWKWEKLNGNWSIGDRPRTLGNLRRCGGVCDEQAYFASRLYKSLGIPAAVNVADGWRRFGIWAGYVTRRKEGRRNRYVMSGAGGVLAAKEVGREQRFASSTYCPVARRTTPTSEVTRLAAAMTHSYDGYAEAVIGCVVYEMFEVAERKSKTSLLTGSIERNPCCGRAWRLLAQACVDGILSGKEAEAFIDRALDALKQSPDLAFEVLEKVLAVRLEAKPDVPGTRIQRDLQVLDRILTRCNRIERYDLAIRLVLLKGDTLVRLGRTKEARKLYILSTGEYFEKHSRFIELFDRALALMKGDENRESRLRFVGLLAGEVGYPPYYVFSGPRGDALLHLIRTYIEELRAAEKFEPADEQEARLKKFTARP